MKLSISFALLFCSLIIISCGSDDHSAKYDVYTVGYKGDGESGPVSYWKNGDEYPVTDGSTVVSIHDIKVSNGDVYIAGVENSSNVGSIAKYWKNGTPVSLSDGTKAAAIYDLNIVGDDVYAVGQEDNKATYWKNGVATRLGNDPYGLATGIAVNGNDVHIVGYDIDSDTTRARYWKNGTSVSLTEKKLEYGILTGVTIDNGDVYIVGVVTKNRKENGLDLKYWKNGSEVLLGHALLTGGIAVNNGDVYTPDLYAGAYWKNQTHIFLIDPSKGSVKIPGLVVTGDDVIAVGNKYDYNGPGNKYLGSILWLNGLGQEPFNGNNNIHLMDVCIGR